MEEPLDIIKCTQDAIKTILCLRKTIISLLVIDKTDFVNGKKLKNHESTQ